MKIKGCPPSEKDLLEAYRELGIELPDNFMEWMANLPETFMRRYIDQPEFDEAFYKIQR